MDPELPQEPRAHQRALQQKYEFLVNNVGASDVIDYLFQEECISIDEKESIEETRGDRKRMRKLLDKLIGKPRATFDVFLDALKKTNTNHVVQVLNEKLAEIHQEDKGEQLKSDMAVFMIDDIALS